MVGGEPSATSGLPNFLVFSSFRSVLDSFFRCFLDSDSLADFSVVVDSFYFPSVLAYSLCSNGFYIPQSGNFWKHSLHIRYVSHALHLNPEFPEGAESHSILWIGLGRNGFHRMGSAAWLMRIFPYQNPLKQTFHSSDVKVWISWAGCLSNQQRSESKNTCDSRRLLRLASNMFAAWKSVKTRWRVAWGIFAPGHVIVAVQGVAKDFLWMQHFTMICTTVPQKPSLSESHEVMKVMKVMKVIWRSLP